MSTRLNKVKVNDKELVTFDANRHQKEPDNPNVNTFCCCRQGTWWCLSATKYDSPYGASLDV